jgi:hypothetical protein
VQPNDHLNLWTVLGSIVLLVCLWKFRDGKRFRGPPNPLSLKSERDEATRFD